MLKYIKCQLCEEYQARAKQPNQKIDTDLKRELDQLVLCISCQEYFLDWYEKAKLDPETWAKIQMRTAELEREEQAPDALNP